jgi:F-type H+/Na+-transporting ATPase subunit beta
LEGDRHDIGMKAIGTIVEVHGPVVHIRCDPLPPLQQALVTQNGKSHYTFEVCQHLDREHLRAITLEHPAGLKRGMTVYDTGGPLRVPVSPAILGRILNVFGAPLDGGPPLE